MKIWQKWIPTRAHYYQVNQRIFLCLISKTLFTLTVPRLVRGILIKIRSRHSVFAFMISFLTHLIIFSFIIFEFSFTKQELKLGKTESMLSSYIYQENLPRKVLQKKPEILPKPQITKPKSITKNALSLHQKNPVLESAKSKEFSTPAKPEEEKGNEKPKLELVALLHASIQEHQKYPENALQMEREGKATLVFILYPDGSIKSLKIVKSSGTHTLDEAALIAVNEAVPFRGVDKYLIDPEEFQITVAFELT